MNSSKKTYIIVIVLLAFVLMFPMNNFAKEKKEKDAYKIPSHVLSISKENTFPNSTEDQEIIEPSELAEELITSLDIKIENPQLIKVLNETTLKPSPISFGYRGMVYIGRWPINYKSSDTTVNWEYQKVNMNELNNLGGDKAQIMNYNQQEEVEIKGALTNKIKNPDNVKAMMLLTSIEKTNLPLAYTTVIGKSTKKDNSYDVPVKKYGYLQAYAPAVNEKGEVTFGEVYIELKGTKKSIVIKNVTKQGIGAWIPIQDHVSYSFQLK